MLDLIILLSLFAFSQFLAYRVKKVQQWSLLKMMGISIAIISISMVIYGLLGSPTPYIIVIPTIVCAAFLSAKYRVKMTSLFEKWKETVKHGA